MVSGFFFVLFEFYAVVSVPFPFFGFPHDLHCSGRW